MRSSRPASHSEPLLGPTVGLPDFTDPRPFEHDAIEINIRVFTLDRPFPPLIDRRIDLLVNMSYHTRLLNEVLSLFLQLGKLRLQSLL